MSDDLIVRVVAKILIPFILLFAVYVQFHGEYGPGGGFQAGVIGAAGFVFYGLIFGLDAAKRVAPDWLVETMVAAGVLLYAAVGVVGMILGGNYLDYFVLGATPIDGQHRGIFWVEVGVGVTVSGVMLKIFYLFADRQS
jgi:multicomponent Na+:H+ antiporter subunit B